jgi:hypothetical protein
MVDKFKLLFSSLRDYILKSWTDSRKYPQSTGVPLNPDYRRFYEALTQAQSKRKRQTDWVAFEAAIMLHEVNAFRAERGKAPVDMTTLKKAEGGALGHSDYTRKFALYCLELAEK